MPGIWSRIWQRLLWEAPLSETRLSGPPRAGHDPLDPDSPVSRESRQMSRPNGTCNLEIRYLLVHQRQRSISVFNSYFFTKR